MERHTILALGLATLLPFSGTASSAAQQHTHGGTAPMSRAQDGRTTVAASTESGEASEGAETGDPTRDRTGLFALEDRAEAIAEGEKTGASALAAGHDVVRRWPGIRAMLAQNGAARAALASADAAINAVAGDLRSRGDLRRDANEVTGAVASLFSVTGDKVPADVHRLDYLGRALALDVQSDAWLRAKADAAALSATWKRLRPTVLGRPGGAAAATEFDAAASQVTAATDSQDARAALAGAKASGDVVDHLEKLWP